MQMSSMLQLETDRFLSKREIQSALLLHSSKTFCLLSTKWLLKIKFTFPPKQGASARQKQNTHVSQYVFIGTRNFRNTINE
jgi:hypothetical protein